LADLGPEPIPHFTADWVAWKIKFLITHEGMKPAQAAAIAHDMARRQKKSIDIDLIEKAASEPVIKFDDALQTVTRINLTPFIPDLQGDIVTPEEIFKAMISFGRCGMQLSINHEIDIEKEQAFVVENYQAPIDIKLDGFEAPAGAWVTTVWLCADLYKQAKEEYRGNSIEGRGRRIPA